MACGTCGGSGHRVLSRALAGRAREIARAVDRCTEERNAKGTQSSKGTAAVSPAQLTARGARGAAGGLVTSHAVGVSSGGSEAVRGLCTADRTAQGRGATRKFVMRANAQWTVCTSRGPHGLRAQSRVEAAANGVLGRASGRGMVERGA